VVGSTFGGQMMSRLKHYKRVGLVGLPLAAVILMPLVIFPAQLSIAVVASLMLVAGAGMGTVFPITTVSVQNAVLPWQLGTATGVVNFVRSLASALLVALYGAFLFGGVGVEGGGAHGVTLEALAAAGHNAVSLAEHFRWVFGAAVVCLCISWLLLVAMEERPLRADAPLMPDAVPAPAE
jgi:MFS family permease